MATRTEHTPVAPAALASPVAVFAANGPRAGAVLTDRPVTGAATTAQTGGRGAGGRLVAVLLAVAVQTVVLAVVALLLVLVQPAATETMLTPTPTPQSAPVAP